jgi:hypothetical protein
MSNKRATHFFPGPCTPACFRHLRFCSVRARPVRPSVMCGGGSTQSNCGAEAAGGATMMVACCGGGGGWPAVVMCEKYAPAA